MIEGLHLQVQPKQSTRLSRLLEETLRHWQQKGRCESFSLNQEDLLCCRDRSLIVTWSKDQECYYQRRNSCLKSYLPWWTTTYSIRKVQCRLNVGSLCFFELNCSILCSNPRGTMQCISGLLKYAHELTACGLWCVGNLHICSKCMEQWIIVKYFFWNT